MEIILKGEGETKLVRKTRIRECCEQCGESATQRHGYLLSGARSNPASSAYGKDDCSWCSDQDVFTCGECKKPSLDGYRWCSTFEVTPDNQRFSHMFLRWEEKEIKEDAAAA